jgi:hypothetical protein
MIGGSSSGLAGRAGRDGVGSADAARRRRQAASRGLFDFSSEAHSGGDPPWPSLGIGGVGRTSGEEVSGASQVRQSCAASQGLRFSGLCTLGLNDYEIFLHSSNELSTENGLHRQC